MAYSIVFSVSLITQKHPDNLLLNEKTVKADADLYYIWNNSRVTRDEGVTPKVLIIIQI